MSANPIKPLRGKAYGSIPHLPGSRRGPADKGLSVEQARICTDRARDKHDLIIVQEKLDGSNVSVAKINAQIVPLIRAGYEAVNSRWGQHRHFANWVFERCARFDALLSEGERCVGEWLMQAHGTIYRLHHEPFVVFDIMRGNERAVASQVQARCAALEFVTPKVIHTGGPLSIEEAMKRIEVSGHGAVDPVEGAVWRVERNGEVDFLGKYVRHDKIDGRYLPEVSGREAIYHWRPGQA